MLKWRAMMALGLSLAGMNLADAGQGIPDIVKSFFPTAKQRFHGDTELGGGQMGQQYVFVIHGANPHGKEQLQSIAKAIMANSGWHGGTPMLTGQADAIAYMNNKTCMLTVVIDNADATLKKGEANLSIGKTC